MGHKFIYIDPEEPVREDPPVDTGRPVPGVKEPDPFGFPNDLWLLAKWAYVAIAAASTALGLLGVARGWVPAAYWGFVLQVASIAVAAHLDDATSGGEGKRKASRWHRPPGGEHPDLAPGTPLGACIDRTLDVATDAELFRTSVGDYLEALSRQDAPAAAASRRLALGALKRFEASALLAADTYDQAATTAPPEVRDLSTTRDQVANIVNDIVRQGALPKPESEMLRSWPVMDEARLVRELKELWRPDAVPPKVSGATLFVLASSALRRLARHAHDFLPNGM